MSENSNSEEIPKEEQIPRADSSASSVISRTSSPEPLQDDASGEETQVNPEQLSADMASRGIISSGSPRQSGIAACDIETNTFGETQETNESKQLLDKHAVSERTSGNVGVQQEMSFFNKDSSTSRPSSASSLSSSLAERTNKPEVFFHDSEGDHLKHKERSFITRAENTTTEVVSICTQTEWSWLKDMELYQEMEQRCKADWDERSDRNVSREVLKSPSVANSHGSVKTRRRKSLMGRRSSVSSDKGQMGDEETVPLPDVDEGNEVKQSRNGVEEGSTGKSKSSGGVPRSRQSVVSSLPRTPKGEDLLFRPPTVEPDSASSSEECEDYDLEQEYLLPSIGPPAILQYMKESQNPPLSNEEVQDREELAKNEMLKMSNSSGPCMFCQQEVLPFPTLEELEKFSPDQLYCCPQYERLIKFELAQRTDKAHLVDEMIDIKPHPPYGTKAARRAAKERAAERAREREMERQRAAGANPTNFYALTRQMKTIAYSLASVKCMEEGWTVRPPSPLLSETKEIPDPFVIEVNPLQLRKQAFLERFYENKRRFLLLLPDGTGTCYYPSGNIAVLITATEKGKFTYLVYGCLRETGKNMNNELRDPLEKVSNSLRRAVSINRSKETDLRTTMNTIQRERRRSFNTWSLKQEKFLRAKQNLVPAMLFDQSAQAQTARHTDAQQEGKNKQRKRRVTLVKAVAPVSLAAAHRDRSSEVNYPLQLPDIASEQNKGSKRKKKSKSQVLPPLITLADSSQFFQESKRERRISERRQPFVSFMGADRARETFEDIEKEKRKARKLSDSTAFCSAEKQESSLSNQSYVGILADDYEEEIVQNSMPDIAEERVISRQGSSLNSDTKDLSTHTSEGSRDESRQRAKGQWEKLRDSLGTISEKKKKADINKFSMMELTKLFEEIRECRYLRVGDHSRFTAEQTSQNTNTCKCLACSIKDKNKLKNHLSAPE